MDDIVLIERGDNAIQVIGNDATTLNAAQSYLVSLSSAKSRATASSILNIFANILGGNDLNSLAWHSVRRDHISAVVTLLREQRNLSPSTINTYLTIVKGVMRECWQKGQIDIDTLERIRSIKRVRGSRIPKGRAIDKDEKNALLDACADSGLTGVRDEAIISLMVGCGLRRSEVVSLDMESVDFEERAVKVLGKGNKERIAFMPSGAWDRLTKWLDDVRGHWDGPLFVRIRKGGDVTNDRLTDQAVYFILEKRQTMSGIAQVSPHDLRRTFATAMLNNGEDISTVKDAMGHASITTTQQYDKRGDARLKAARDRMDI